VKDGTFTSIIKVLNSETLGSQTLVIASPSTLRDFEVPVKGDLVELISVPTYVPDMLGEVLRYHYGKIITVNDELLNSRTLTEDDAGKDFANEALTPVFLAKKGDSVQQSRFGSYVIHTNTENMGVLSGKGTSNSNSPLSIYGTRYRPTIGPEAVVSLEDINSFNALILTTGQNLKIKVPYNADDLGKVLNLDLNKINSAEGYLLAETVKIYSTKNGIHLNSFKSVSICANASILLSSAQRVVINAPEVRIGTGFKRPLSPAVRFDELKPILENIVGKLAAIAGLSTSSVNLVEPIKDILADLNNVKSSKLKVE
jgi:hypothetical protein